MQLERLPEKLRQVLREEVAEVVVQGVRNEAEKKVGDLKAAAVLFGGSLVVDCLMYAFQFKDPSIAITLAMPSVIKYVEAMTKPPRFRGK
ncbi:hypothetical protein D9Q98_009177 [Chlorella vulgaris]|uniref:Uncharacterized protein n=1 Tax=Chlorella vulgaris TaxID=3077 RepID=A0A9D4YWV8_CHLVU|nr:hypothetical protein D9Q98_009177 [Chlorella vulgaris]